MKDICLRSLFFLIISYSTCLGQIRNTKFELEKEDRFNITLNGRVKTIKIRTDNLKSKLSDSLAYSFDKNGIIEKFIFYGLGLDVVERRLRTEEVHYIFKEGKLISKLNALYEGLDGDMYRYDKNLNLVLLKNYMNNVLVKEIIFNYDDTNRKTERTEYLYGAFSGYNEITQQDKPHYLYEIEKYEYDSNNLLIVKRTYGFRENKTMEKIQYKYDGANNLIEEGRCISYGIEDCDCKPMFGFEYSPRNLVSRKYQHAKFSPHNTDQYFQYDANGREIDAKGIYIYPDKEPVLGYHITYVYDAFGNRTQEETLVGRYNRLGFEEYKTQLMHYDKFQNRVLDEYLTADGTVIKQIRKKYVYDKKNNWIKVETEEGKDINDLKLIEISEREIEYY